MNTMPSPTQSDFVTASLLVKPSVEASAGSRANLKHDKLPDRWSWLGKLAPLAFARYLIAFFIGVAATLAWQSYGGAARDVITPTAPSLDQQELNAMSLDLDAVRQSIDRIATGFAASQEQMRRNVDRLGARQEWMTRDFNSKLEAVEHNIIDKISTLPPRPAPAPARNPVPRPSQAPMLRSDIP